MNLFSLPNDSDGSIYNADLLTGDIFPHNPIAKFAISVSSFFERLVESEAFLGVVHSIFLGKLFSLGYPPCIHLTQEEQDEITSLMQGSSGDIPSDETVKAVQEIIFSSYDDGKLDSIFDRWKKCAIISGARLIALAEAIDAYKQGMYYASVAIIITQIEKIIKEVNEQVQGLHELYPKSESKELYDETLIEQRNEFQEKHKDDDSKKFSGNIPKLRAERIFGSATNFIAIYLDEYFREFLFCRINDNDNKLLTHPNRDKICHGVDENFGTQAKALKLILCVDGLILMHFAISDELNEEDGINKISNDIDNEQCSEKNNSD